MNDQNKTTLLERVELLLVRLYEAGKALGPWQYLMAELKGAPEAFKKDFEADETRKLKQLNQELDKMRSECQVLDGNIAEIQKRHLNDSLLVSAVLADENNKGSELANCTRVDAINYSYSVSWYRKYWFLIIALVTISETILGYKLLVNSISENITGIEPEYLAAALMTGFLFITIKIASTMFKKDNIIKFGKFGLMIGALSLLGFLIVTRGYMANVAESEVNGFLLISISTLLVFSTVLLPLAGGLLIDQVFKANWDKDDQKMNFMVKLKRLILEEERSFSELNVLKVKHSNLIAVINTKERESKELINKITEIKFTNEFDFDSGSNMTLIKSGVHQYIRGMQSLDAIQCTSIDSRLSVRNELEDYLSGFSDESVSSANKTADINPLKNNWSINNTILQ